MTNKRTEQVKELLNNPRSGLKDSSDTNKTRMEILAIVSELEDEIESANKRTDEEIIEEFEKLFKFDGVTYKGNRHWREDIKRNLVSNWIKKALKEARADEREKHNTYTRITIVDHRKNGEGRVYDMRDDDMQVSFSEQDGGKTLKVFLTTKTI